MSRWARASRSPGVPLWARPVEVLVVVLALSSGRSFSFCVTFVVLWGPILVAVPGAGGGKWIVVGGYSVGRGGGTNGFFFVAMVCDPLGRMYIIDVDVVGIAVWSRGLICPDCVWLLTGIESTRLGYLLITSDNYRLRVWNT